MADLFKNPIQALVGSSGSTSLGPLALVQKASSENSLLREGVDPAWVYLGDDIEGANWNKSFPYQLLILRRSPKGGYTTAYRFTLPIPPQEMSMSTPFAINTSLTLGGVVEEHNGTPIRLINFSGTTGVVPLKGTGKTLGQGSVLRGIFAGTVNKFENNLMPAVQSLLGQQPQANLVGTDEDTLKGTGYYQFRLLQQFLERYATMKKQGGADFRLALAMWKDQAIYLVTPVSFDVRRSAQSPHEYSYTLAFKGWRRINPDTTAGETSSFIPVSRDPNAFAQLLGKVEDARRVLEGASATLQAIGGDIRNDLLEPLREVTLFCKDAIGVAVSAADLPKSIQQSLKAATLASRNLTNIFTSSDTLVQLQELSQDSGLAITQGGLLQGGQQALDGAGAANVIFERPEEFFGVMSQIRPSDLNLAPSIQKRISDERTRVRQMDRSDFEEVRDRVIDLEASFADSVGAGSDTFNAIYGRPTVQTKRTPSVDDFEVLFALNQLALELDKLASTSPKAQTPTTLETVAGMASAAGIAFKVPVSKFAVPFPYGSTLEQLAAQYLGDPNRWHEIAALNGLRQPYVDEEGFSLPLLTNPYADNSITVSDISNLVVGQLVYLSASGQPRVSRRITKIVNAGLGMNFVWLDGDPITSYTTAAQATLQTFLPNTVNSQQLIYIPSDVDPGEDDFIVKSIPGLNEFDDLIETGGVDLLLTQDGDLALNQDGDCRLAIGLTNLVQRVKLALSTPRGSVLHHPDYGLGLQPGMSTADVDAKQVLSSIQAMFASDPSFSGVTSVAISKAGPALRLAMNVGISGVNRSIPVSVDIRQ